MISKNIAVLAVIVLVMVVGFYFLGQSKEGRVMDVNVEIYLDEEETVHISSINGTLREVNKISIPKGGDVISPGIVANAIYNGSLIGYWTSTGVNTNMTPNSTASYNLTIGLFENPPEGENVTITARVVGFGGGTLESRVAIIET